MRCAVCGAEGPRVPVRLQAGHSACHCRYSVLVSPKTRGLTFSLYDATPEQCQLSAAADFYGRYSWQKVVDGVQHCAPGKGKHRPSRGSFMSMWNSNALQMAVPVTGSRATTSSDGEGRASSYSRAMTWMA